MRHGTDWKAERSVLIPLAIAMLGAVFGYGLLSPFAMLISDISHGETHSLWEVFTPEFALWAGSFTIFGTFLGLALGLMYDSLRRKSMLIRRAKEFTELVLDSMEEGVVAIGADYRVISANRSFISTTNVENSSVVGRRCYEVSHGAQRPCERPDHDCPIHELRTTGKPAKTIHKHKDRFGKERFIELTAYPLRDGTGEIEQFVEISRDITDQREAEKELQRSAQELATLIAELQNKHEALQKSEKRLQSILDHCTAPVYLKDMQGRYTIVNRSFGEAACHAPEQIVGKSDSELFPANIASRRQEQDVGVLLNREPISVEEVLPAAGQQGPQTYLSVKFPVFDEHGVPCGVGGFSTDITERKQVEELRNEFVSIVSHELRTPLTAIRGSLGLIDGGVIPPVSERGKKLLRMAVGNTDRLIRLLNDILDLDKIESREMTLTTHPVDISQLITPLLEDLTALAQASKISLVYHHPGVSLPVRADPDRLVQVVTNLVHNAIKFSPPDTTVELRSTALPSGFVRISVSDSGQGISKQNQAKIFTKFSQLDTSATRHAGGTGLGLAICKTIVTQHGGTIGVDSTPGRGSTFYFTIPQATLGARKPFTTYENPEKPVASTSIRN